MKDRITALAERFEAFSLRERGLIAMAVLVVMFMLWDSLLLSPEEVRQKNIVAEMHNINQQTEAVTTQIREMSAALKGGEAESIRLRITELHTLLANLEKQQTELTVEFIQPSEMASVLRDMLQAENGLVMTRLESLGAEPLFHHEKDAGDKTPAEEKQIQQPEIFKHSMRIVFEGDFFKTLHYLHALEGLPWRLYWDNVEYQVTKYPRASIAITVHTLSLHKGWIGV